MYKKLSTLQDKLKINRQDFIGKVTADIVEFINGIHVLKIYNMAEKRFSKTAEAVKNLRDFSVRAELAHIPVVSLFQFCLRLVTAGIVFSSALLFLRGTLSFAHIFLLMTASFGLFSGIEAMGIFSIFSKMTQQSIDRMNAIKAVPEMQNLSGNLLLDPQKPHAFDIQFEDVSFAYAEKEVLHNISFSVPEKTVTALAGLSGSGKTTIVNLLARFWDIKKGRISIGGTDIKELNYENLLHNISFVFQENKLFKESILENIRYGKKDASREEVMEALRKAECMDIIEKLPAGIDTVYGTKGTYVSGGEAQRLAIARALLQDAPIIVLDEATAFADAENEYKIKKTFDVLLKDKTVIMIAHRLSSVINADKICVINEGRIAEEGSHTELLARNGLYATMWDNFQKGIEWKV